MWNVNRKRIFTRLLWLPIGLITLLRCNAAPEKAPLRFEVTITEEALSEIAQLGLDVPVTGRVFVIITRDGDSEPRLQTGIMGVPLWGMDVRDLEAGKSVVFADKDPDVRGYLLNNCPGLPP